MKFFKFFHSLLNFHSPSLKVNYETFIPELSRIHNFSSKVKRATLLEQFVQFSALCNQ